MDQITTKCGRQWNPAELALIVSLNLDGEAGKMEVLGRCQSKSRPVWPDFDAEFYDVALRFQNVQNLTMKGFFSMPNQIMGFFVDDARHRQMAGVNYEIGDYENGAISFWASQMSVGLLD